MRYVTAALVIAVLFLSMQLHTANDRIAVLESKSTVYSKPVSYTHLTLPTILRV